MTKIGHVITTLENAKHVLEEMIKNKRVCNADLKYIENMIISAIMILENDWEKE